MHDVIHEELAQVQSSIIVDLKETRKANLLLLLAWDMCTLNLCNTHYTSVLVNTYSHGRNHISTTKVLTS